LPSCLGWGMANDLMLAALHTRDHWAVEVGPNGAIANASILAMPEQRAERDCGMMVPTVRREAARLWCAVRRLVDRSDRLESLSGALAAWSCAVEDVRKRRREAFVDAMGEQMRAAKRCRVSLEGRAWRSGPLRHAVAMWRGEVRRSRERQMWLRATEKACLHNAGALAAALAWSVFREWRAEVHAACSSQNSLAGCHGLDLHDGSPDTSALDHAESFSANGVQSKGGGIEVTPRMNVWIAEDSRQASFQESQDSPQMTANFLLNPAEVSMTFQADSAVGDKTGPPMARFINLADHSPGENKENSRLAERSPERLVEKPVRHLCLGPSRLSLTSLGTGSDRVGRTVTSPEVCTRSSNTAHAGQGSVPRGPFARSSSQSSMTSQPSYTPAASTTSQPSYAPPPVVQPAGGSLRAEPGLCISAGGIHISSGGASARSSTCERGRRATSPGASGSPRHRSPSAYNGSPCTPRWVDATPAFTQDVSLPRGPERFYYDTTTYTGCARYGGPTVRDNSVGRGSPKWKKDLRSESATLCRKAGRASTVLSFSFAGNAPPPTTTASGSGSLRAPPGHMPGLAGDRFYRKASFR